MKVVFFVLSSIVLFLLASSFIVQNPQDIEIHYYFGMVWDGPLAILLLLTLVVGVLFGVFICVMHLLKLKIRLIKVAKQLRVLQSNYSLDRKQIVKDGN